MLLLPSVSLGDIETTVLPFAGPLRSATSELNLKINAVDTQYKQAKLDYPTLGASWDGFRLEFYAWWKSWRDSWNFDSNEVRDQLLVFRRRFNEIQADFASTTKTPSNVTPYTKDQRTSDRPNDPSLTKTISDVAKSALWIAAIIGGGYVVGQVAGVFKASRKVL